MLIAADAKQLKDKSHDRFRLIATHKKNRGGPEASPVGNR